MNNVQWKALYIRLRFFSDFVFANATISGWMLESAILIASDASSRFRCFVLMSVMLRSVSITHYRKCFVFHRFIRGTVVFRGAQFAGHWFQESNIEWRVKKITKMPWIAHSACKRRVYSRNERGGRRSKNNRAVPPSPPRSIAHTWRKLDVDSIQICTVLQYGQWIQFIKIPFWFVPWKNAL